MSKERLQKIQSKGILRPEIMVIKEETAPYLSIGAFLAGPAWGWEAAQNRQKKIIDLKIKPKPDYPLKTLYPRAFQTGLNRLIYYDFTTVE